MKTTLREKSQDVENINQCNSEFTGEVNKLKEIVRQRDFEIERILTSNSELKKDHDRLTKE